MNRRWVIAALVPAVALILVGPYFIAQYSYFVHILIMVCYLAYLGTCWNIVGGYAGQPSLGHAAFIGIGAYTSSVLFTNWGITPWIGTWVGGLLAVLFGLFGG